MAHSKQLTPLPQHICINDGFLDPTPGFRFTGPFDSEQIRWARQFLIHSQVTPSAIPLHIAQDQSMDSQAYRLDIHTDRVTICAKDSAGACYALATLNQWLNHHDQEAPPPIPCATVIDHPDIPIRGALLDISRDKVPTMATLFEIIDLLALLKINQLQLYMEHTFAYSGHEEVWRHADPLTAQQIRELDTACRLRHIELVPNQNSFGHFHRWLKHTPYRSLAEIPQGIIHPFSIEKEPFSLCPLDERVPPFLADLYSQLLPNFSSDMFNVGLDETFDLGMGRSKKQCESKGKTQVYLEFLEKVRRLAAAHQKRIQFWGDIIIQQPHLTHLLPKDAVALEWGYEADHPFQEHAACFAKSGLDFYICPGTGTWNSIGGRITNTLANLKAAARAAENHGAAGMLITDWGDYGHLQPLPVSLPGLVAGAAIAWRTNDPFLNRDSLIYRLNQLVFKDHSNRLGEALVRLGEVCDQAACQPTNGTAPFFLLRFADADLEHERLQGLTPQDLTQIAESATAAVKDLNESNHHNAQIRQELEMASQLINWLCRFGIARFETGTKAPIEAVKPKTRKQLIHGLDQFTDVYQKCWLLRNRRGGLHDSLAALRRIRHALS